jgi:hypothetical protein
MNGTSRTGKLEFLVDSIECVNANFLLYNILCHIFIFCVVAKLKLSLKLLRKIMKED